MNGLHYSKAQRVRVAERDRLSIEIRNGWHLYDMMCKCGSKEDADANLKPKINEMVLERERLERSIHDESRKGTSALLMTLCACDLLTELADVFGYTLTEISRGAEPANNAFPYRLQPSLAVTEYEMAMFDLYKEMFLHKSKRR